MCTALMVCFVPGHFLFQLANVFLLLSYLGYDVLFLRVVLGAGSLCFVLWAVFVLEVALDTALWNTAFLIINAVYAAQIAYSRRPITFERPQRPSPHSQLPQRPSPAAPPQTRYCTPACSNGWALRVSRSSSCWRKASCDDSRLAPRASTTHTHCVPALLTLCVAGTSLLATRPQTSPSCCVGAWLSCPLQRCVGRWSRASTALPDS